MEEEKVAELRGVSVAFQKRYALKGISLSIKKGEFVGIAGPNGSGKSTLLRLFNGLVIPTTGAVELFGRSLSGRRVRAARRKIGYLPQRWDYDSAYPAAVQDIIMMGRWPLIGFLRRPSPEDWVKVRGASSRLGIGDLLRRPVGHLSGGERQKMGIARAMAQEPNILLLDEPTSDLDLAAQAEIRNLIECVYNEGGLTVLFVTHFLSHLPPCCSRIILMKSGQVVYDGSREGAMEDKTLSSLYDWPVEKIEIGGRVAVFPRRTKWVR